ncbi:hypothetical protein GCM10027072_76160 [Streptomyces bullii]
MAGDPSVGTTIVGRRVVAKVSGEMHHLTSPDLGERIKGLPAGGKFLVLDVSGVSFCDSAGSKASSALVDRPA